MSEQHRGHLLQEILVEQDPTGWRMLVGCILLNCTSRTQVDKVWPALFDAKPNATRMRYIDDEVAALLKPLGFGERRRKTLMEFSEWWTRTNRPAGYVRECVPPGIGPYARDSWLIFVDRVVPQHEVGDRELKIYLTTDRAPRS